MGLKFMEISLAEDRIFKLKAERRLPASGKPPTTFRRNCSLCRTWERMRRLGVCGQQPFPNRIEEKLPVTRE